MQTNIYWKDFFLVFFSILFYEALEIQKKKR